MNMTDFHIFLYKLHRTEDLGHHSNNCIYNNDNKHLQPYFKIYIIDIHQQPPTLDIENITSAAKLCKYNIFY